jgi:hypothetical protein
VSPIHAAELRHITILHCAIASAGALAVTLDPENWHEIVAFHACCSESVEKFGGSLVQSPDDSLVAWFGHPGANEFDAEHAVRAGLALISAVPKLCAVLQASILDLTALIPDQPTALHIATQLSQRVRRYCLVLGRAQIVETLGGLLQFGIEAADADSTLLSSG